MVLCLVGLALMTLSETLKPAFGDVICLFAAVFYSVDLMITERAVADERVDPLALGVCDLAVVGVVISVLSVFLETPALPGTAKVWAASLFLGIVCSGVCLVIQSVFQRHTTASRASLILRLSRCSRRSLHFSARRAHRRQGLSRRCADACEPCAGGGRRGRIVQKGKKEAE